MTLSELLTEGSRRLEHLDLPRLESMVLFSHLTGITKEKLLAMGREPLPDETAGAFFNLIERRASGEPSAYIVGHREFFGRELKVTPSVLIPRPDTEILVEEALSLMDSQPIASVWDLCTGSSAIILSVAAETLERQQTTATVSVSTTRSDYQAGTQSLKGCDASREVRFFASDISPEALAIAKENLEHYKVPVELFKGNLLDAMPAGLRVDMILTNPPYLEDSECDDKISENWAEPDLALRGGEDGLDLIREIIKSSVDKLNPHGYLLIEASGWQMDAMEECMQEQGFCNCRRIKDLAGIERVLCGELSQKSD